MIDPTNRNSALASALVCELRRCGLRRAVLSPGSRSTPLALALDRDPGIELSIVLDERSAGFVALGAALGSGAPVAVACTSGSAAANLHPAVVEADQAGVPLIVLTSDRPPELRDIGAGQTIDQIKLYGDAVRWFKEVGTQEADDAGLLHHRAVACRGWAEARSGRGPVHLNLSWRDPLGPEPAADDVTASDQLALVGRHDGRPLTDLVPGREPSPPMVEAVAARVEASRRPLIVAGRQTDPRLAAAVSGFALRIGAPILAEPTSQLRHGPHDRSGVIAAYDLIVRDAPRPLDPDLVIRFGDMPTSKALRLWLSREGAPEQVIVDPPGRWNEPSRRECSLLRTDPLAVLAALSERLEERSDGEYLGRWLDAESAAQSAIDAELEAAPGSEPALLRGLGDVLADGEQVLLASSMPVRNAEAFMRGSGAKVAVFANRGANGIDGLVSTAAGLAAGAARPTWAVLGDLALAHDLGGLATVATAPAPVRLLVLDNGGGRIFEFLPQASQLDRERFERLFITPSGLDLERAAGLFDIPYLSVESVDDLSRARKAGSALIHARLPVGDNVALHRRLTAAVAAALPGLHET